MATLVPNHSLFITLLVVFEAAVGVLVLIGGRAAMAGMFGAFAMHLGLLPFGWVITIWSVVMLTALGLLLRAQWRDLHHRTPVVIPERVTVSA